MGCARAFISEVCWFLECVSSVAVGDVGVVGDDCVGDTSDLQAGHTSARQSARRGREGTPCAWAAVSLELHVANGVPLGRAGARYTVQHHPTHHKAHTTLLPQPSGAGAATPGPSGRERTGGPGRTSCTLAGPGSGRAVGCLPCSRHCAGCSATLCGTKKVVVEGAARARRSSSCEREHARLSRRHARRMRLRRRTRRLAQCDANKVRQFRHSIISQGLAR
jgi:hypothetical protein